MGKRRRGDREGESVYTCTREWGMGGVKLSECVRFTVTQCAYVFMGVGVCVCAHVSVCMHVIVVDNL